MPFLQLTPQPAAPSWSSQVTLSHCAFWKDQFWAGVTAALK